MSPKTKASFLNKKTAANKIRCFFITADHNALFVPRRPFHGASPAFSARLSLVVELPHSGVLNFPN